MLGLKKLVNDRNPWVRKTVAGGLAKVYEYVPYNQGCPILAETARVDPSSLSQLIPLLQTLLASSSPLTLGATLTAFLEMCPERLDLLHPYYRHICRLLVDADEWAQIVALQVILIYARSMLDKPDTAGNARPPQTKANAVAKATSNGHNGSTKHQQADDEDSEDEFEGVDTDLAMFLHLSKPLFQSRNPAVILGMANAYYHLAPAGNGIIGQEWLVAPLLRLAGSSSGSTTAGEEIAALTWGVIASMAEERPVSMGTLVLPSY
jgi:AP-3 complex subunit beta